MLQLLRRYENFRIAVMQHQGGIAIELKNAASIALVDSETIRGPAIASRCDADAVIAALS